MKIKTFLLIIVLIFSSFYVSALDLSLCGEIGLALNNIHGTFVSDREEMLISYGAESTEKQIYPTYVAGFYLRADFLSFLGIMSGLQFGPNGGAIIATNSTTRLIGITVNTLRLPLYLLGYLQVGPGQVTIAAGGYAGIKLTDPVEVYREGSLRTETKMTGESAGPIFFGLCGSIGYNLPCGPGFIVFDVRYQWGLTTIVQSEQINGSQLTADSLEFSAGYRFLLK